MEYSALGNTNIKISKIGFGCWATSKIGWKDVNSDEAVETLNLAYEKGINFFDTAPIYGFGQSEKIIGETFKNIRSKIVIATKFGLRWNDRGVVSHDISSDSLMYELDASLKRLNSDYIDLYQIHWPDNKTNIDIPLKKLQELKDSGVIKSIGVSNFSIELLKKSVDICKIDSVQDKFNFIERDAAKELLPFCIENSISFLAYSPLAQGILSGKVKKGYTPSKNDIRRFNPLINSDFAYDEVKILGKNPAIKALDFVISAKGVSSALISMTKREHLLQNLSLFI
jgi:aryl-alcohol dehydrogenase-like predicted oxidoreductase